MMATYWIVDIMSVIFLMPTQEFGDTVTMTISPKLVILPKVVYIIESNRETKRKKVMSGSTYLLFVFYIITSHITKYSSIYFQEFTTISKINHTKKVIEYMNVFRKCFIVRQEVSYEIQTSIYFIKYGLQTSIENNISCKIK